LEAWHERDQIPHPEHHHIAGKLCYLHNDAISDTATAHTRHTQPHATQLNVAHLDPFSNTTSQTNSDAA
jgi:hypothetical protein